MSNDNVSAKSPTALKEEQTLGFWRNIDAFKKTVEKDAPKGEYVFFDGPPFATGTPHYGHLLASAIKDAIPRYKTMNGFRVLRKWGWDCHGLPIENMVEKDLGLSGKKQIEALGLEKFNEHARSKVLMYAGEWKKTIERMARWVDFDGSYKTMDNSYIESVWWGLKQLHEQGKIYESVKVLMYCPRCETPLSNAEVAMDNSYKDITDISVYAKFKLVGEENTFVLAWTTTPWTLPGNVALAINGEVVYCKIKIKSEKVKKENQDSKLDTEIVYVLAKERAEEVLKNYEYEIVGEMKGSELVGKSYEPIFDYYKDIEIKNKENGWKICAGDFVTTTDGTGVVHIAPAFGEDDLALAKKNNLPIIHHVDGTGKFKPEVTDFAGQSVKPKDTKEEPTKHQSADIEIIKWLAHNGKLFEKQKIVHSYPHCYRCETPIYYYAIPAWFLEIQSSKEKFLKLNEKINWIPGHLKEGRFKNVMENAPDWNISRNRFWATPLPFWKSDETGEIEVLGSADDIRKRTKSTNKYFVMRHGEADNNVQNILSSMVENSHHLTEKGREVTKKAGGILKDKNITKIIVSPYARTKETAAIVADVIGFDKNKISTDERIKEFDFGDFNLKNLKETFSSYWESRETRFDKAAPNGENLNDVRKRVGQFIYEIDRKFHDETILIVTHGAPSMALEAVVEGLNQEQILARWISKDFLTNSEIKELDFAPIPHNALYEFDFHRPYIDAITYPAPSGNGVMKRVPEVIDCWFESASMPYASQHYPFENQDFFKTHFPADFIAEYIAQTRTWFYYTHAVSAMLFGDIAYKNVVTTGTVLAEDGQKMSKSKNNFPDPWIMFDKYGADAVRFYLLASPLMRSEDLNFAEREVDEIHKKIILRMRNVLSFYEMYKGDGVEMRDDSKHVLDMWIVERLRQMHADATSGMEVYEIDRSLKAVMPFVDDLSTWYLRRSRDRMKEGGEDAQTACATLRFVLTRFAQIMAPVTPFIAEELYQGVRSENDEVSVHFTSWPDMTLSLKEKVKHTFTKTTIVEDMAKVRQIVSLALEARSAAGIKIRQPLATLAIKNESELLSNQGYVGLIKDEINVKSVTATENNETPVWLDTVITPELKEEGDYRDLVRFIQDLRKNKNLKPQDRVGLIVSTDGVGKKLVEKFSEEIKKVAGIEKIEFSNLENVEKIKVGDSEFGFNIS